MEIIFLKKWESNIRELMVEGEGGIGDLSVFAKNFFVY